MSGVVLRAWVSLAGVWVGLAASAAGCTYGTIHSHEQDAGSADGGDGGDSGHDEDAAARDAGSDAASGDSGSADGDASTPDSGGPKTKVPSPPVQPYYTAAPRWNDYVQQDAPAAACVAVDAQTKCFHGGAVRKVVLSDEPDCNDLHASDDAGWFSWACEVKGDVVQLRGTLVQPSLVKLIDWAHAGFAWNAVTVKRGDEVVARTKPAPLWSNVVHALPSAPNATLRALDETSAVYLLTRPLAQKLEITADRVALVEKDSGPAEGPLTGPSSVPALSASGEVYLWIEGLQIPADGLDTGVHLDVSRSVIRSLHATRSPPQSNNGADLEIFARASVIEDLSSSEAPKVGVRIQATETTITGLDVSSADGNCIELSGGDSTVDDVRAMGCGGMGVWLAAFDRSLLTRVRVSTPASDGVALVHVQGTALRDVYVANAGGTGVSISGDAGGSSANDTLQDVVATGNMYSGVSAQGDNLRVTNVLAASNLGDGLYLESHTGVALHTTALFNAGAGLRVSNGTLGGSIIESVLENNSDGLLLDPGAVGCRVRDVFSTNNGDPNLNHDQDLTVNGENTAFEGTIALTTATSCKVASGLTTPGFTTTPSCAVVGTAGGQVLAPFSIAPELVGKVADGPDYAQLDLQGNADPATIDDWTAFASPRRFWGKQGTPGDYALRGPCRNSPACTIWDARVTASSLLADPLGNTPYTEACDAAHVVVHTWYATSLLECMAIPGGVWSDACRTSFVDYGYQPISALTRDGLCDASATTCLAVRARGGYVGEGALEALGTVPVMIGSANLAFDLKRYDSLAQ